MLACGMFGQDCAEQVACAYQLPLIITSFSTSLDSPFDIFASNHDKTSASNQPFTGANWDFLPHSIASGGKVGVTIFLVHRLVWSRHVADTNMTGSQLQHGQLDGFMVLCPNRCLFFIEQNRQYGTYG